MAASWRSLKWVSLSLLIFIFLFQSSHTTFLGTPTTTALARASNTPKQDVEKFNTVKKWSVSDARSVEDSARKVPTGPDPLHHHQNPTGP